MTKKAKRRPNVKDLPRQVKQLSATEQKQVKGGLTAGTSGSNAANKAPMSNSASDIANKVKGIGRPDKTERRINLGDLSETERELPQMKPNRCEVVCSRPVGVLPCNWQ